MTSNQCQASKVRKRLVGQGSTEPELSYVDCFGKWGNACKSASAGQRMNTLVRQTMEVWGGPNMEVQRQAGALVGQHQVLVCPVVTGYLTKQQLLL